MGSGQGRKTPGFWADSKIILGFGAARDATRTAKKKTKKSSSSSTTTKEGDAPKNLKNLMRRWRSWRW